MLVAYWMACSPDAGAPDSGGTDDTGTTPEVSTPLGTGTGVLPSKESDWRYVLGAKEQLDDPRDLGFDPDGNLWIANRKDDHTFIVFDPGTVDQTFDRRMDGYAMHFMEETAAFAFEDPSGAEQFGNEFGSCGESENTYNDTQRANEFMGPVLWSTDLDIFGEKNPYGLGSHLDMQHESPDCVGLAWDHDNVYWVFDGFHDTIVRYDFEDNHGIGEDDHSDGIVYQLTEPTVTHVHDAPGHMEIDRETGILYVADTGGDRVLWIDTNTGEQGADLAMVMEKVETYAAWDDTEWGVFADGLDQPGGLALDGAGHVLVAEYGTGILHAYDLDGNELQSLDTGWGAGAAYGIEVGSDGALWAVDHGAPAVYRLTPPIEAGAQNP
jgi:DNA-binding beta-propeller fold protein YncE